MAGVFRFVTTLPLLPPKHSKTPKRVYVNAFCFYMPRAYIALKRVVTVVTKPYNATGCKITSVTTGVQIMVTEWKQWKHSEVMA